MKKIVVRVLVVAAVLAVLAVAAVFIFLNSIIKGGVERAGPGITKTPLQVGVVDLSVLSGSGAVKKIVVGNPEGFKSQSAIEMDDLQVALLPSSLLSDKLVVRSIKVAAPRITYELGTKGSNLQRILDNIQEAVGAAGGGQTSKDSTASRKLQLDELIISGGQIHLASSIVGNQAMTFPLPEIHLNNLGQGPDGITAGDLMKIVLTEVTQGAVKAVGNVGGKAIDAASDAGKGILNKAKGVGDLLKKTSRP